MKSASVPIAQPKKDGFLRKVRSIERTGDVVHGAKLDVVAEPEVIPGRTWAAVGSVPPPDVIDVELFEQPGVLLESWISEFSRVSSGVGPGAGPWVDMVGS